MFEPEATHAIADGAPRVAALLAASLVGVAFLVARYAPSKRRHVRVALVAFSLFLLVAGVGALLERTDSRAEAAHLWSLALLLQHVVGIELAGTLLFYIVLPQTRLVIPNIFRDLVVGAAYGAAGVALLHRLGVEVSSLLASGAVVTLVLGLSLQATLGNAIGGMALQLDGSIREGDWIRLPDKTEGRVRQIRWRHTVVETRNWDTVIVPNAQLLQRDILILGKRHGEPLQHRMWVYFDVDFRYSPERVIEVVESALRAAPVENVAELPPPNCICVELSREMHPSFARYAVRYWLTDIARDDPTSSLINARISVALSRAGIPLAIPAQTIFITDVNRAHAERKQHEEETQRAAMLARLELFDSMTDEERIEVARKLRYAPFCKNEIVTRQGAEAHWLYIIAAGSAEIRIRNESGEESLVAKVVAPTIIGEMGLMTGEPRRATVLATSAVECYRLDKEDFREILSRRAEIAEEMAHFLAQRKVELDAAEEHLDDGSRGTRVGDERSRILGSVKRFFGLDDDPRSLRRSA